VSQPPELHPRHHLVSSHLLVLLEQSDDVVRVPDRDEPIARALFDRLGGGVLSRAAILPGGLLLEVLV
jgi:hypothetical protein